MGESTARDVLQRHETIAGDTLNGNFTPARQMDLVNNEIGIAIGNRARAAGNSDFWDLWRQADTAVRLGPAVWIKSINQDSYSYKPGPAY